jgi:tetratricopeptide (TPR) repeat protein
MESARTRVSLSAVLLTLTFALPCAAQPPRAPSTSTGGPTCSTAPDEEPNLRAPASATIARQAAIEAMASADPGRPDAMFELAEAFRASRDAEREIRTLARLVQDHPDWMHFARVLFRLARALDASHQGDQARMVWMRLVQYFPSSDYVQAAYVAFGDRFFADGDLAAARQFYERATTYARARWSAYAEYRLAWVLATQRDRAALTHLTAAAALVGEGTAAPQLGSALVRTAINADQAAIGAMLAGRP